MNRASLNLFWSLLSLLAWSLTSCEKEEPLYARPEVPAGLQTREFAMGENYENQIWFHFGSQTGASNAFGLWDIAFACDDNPHVIINGGKNQAFSLASFPNLSYDQVGVDELTSAQWSIDVLNGQQDSLAFGAPFQYESPGHYSAQSTIYVLDRGDDSLGSERYIKIQLTGYRAGVYSLRWGYLHEVEPRFTTYMKVNDEKNYVYYSFAKKNDVQNEPLHKSAWDVVFTTYKEPVPEPGTGILYPYVLRGVLINPTHLQVCEVGPETPFETMNLAKAQSLPFNRKLNEIGYDWKAYDQNMNQYTIVPNKYFVIRDVSGNFFKIKFVSFYNDQGIKGFPKMAWEYLR